MLNQLNKLSNVLLEGEDHCVGACVKRVGDLGGNEQSVTVT